MHVPERDIAAAERRPNSSRRSDNVDARRPEHGPTGHDALLSLQSVVGNHAVAELIEDPGQRIRPEDRRRAEASLARDFSDVRVHRGGAADEASDRLEAAAFTLGSDIYIRSDTPTPDTALGKIILAEELTHVAQGVGRAPIERMAPEGGPIEQQAHASAIATVTGQPSRVGESPGAAAQTGRILPLLPTGLFLYGVWKLWEELTDDEKVEAAKSGAAGDAAKAAEQKAAEARAEADKKRLNAEQSSEIQFGAIQPLELLLTRIDSAPLPQLQSALELPTNTVLHATVPEAARDDTGAALQQLIHANNVILAALAPGAAKDVTVKTLAEDGNELTALAGAAVKEAEASQGGTANPDALSPGTAHQLEGYATRTLQLSAELSKATEKEDFSRIAGEISSIGAAVASVDARGALAGKVKLFGLKAENHANTISALAMSKEEALALAKGQIGIALGLLRPLAGVPEPPPAEGEPPLK
jgi:hypothetical protein